MKLQRYAKIECSSGGDSWIEMIKEKSGSWVKYTDVEKLEKRIEALEEGLRTIAECSSDAVARICAVCTLGEEGPQPMEEKE